MHVHAHTCARARILTLTHSLRQRAGRQDIMWAEPYEPLRERAGGSVRRCGRAQGLVPRARDEALLAAVAATDGDRLPLQGRS